MERQNMRYPYRVYRLAKVPNGEIKTLIGKFETREQAERSFRASDKEAWLRIAEQWMKLAETRKEPVAGVIGAFSRIYAVK